MDWLAHIRESFLYPPEDVLIILSVVSDNLVVVQYLLTLQLDKFVNSALNHDDDQLVVAIRIWVAIRVAEKLMDENYYFVQINLFDHFFHYLY